MQQALRNIKKSIQRHFIENLKMKLAFMKEVNY